MWPAALLGIHFLQKFIFVVVRNNGEDSGKNQI